MATKPKSSTKSSKKAASLPRDSKGRPDMYKMKEDGTGLREAAEQAGISYATAHVYFREQELEHNPDLVIKTKGVPKDRLCKKLSELRNSGIRWETLAVRSGLSVAEVKKAVAEAQGVNVEDLAKRTSKPKPPKKTAAKKTSKKAEPEPDEDEDEDVEEDDDDEDDDADDIIEDDDDDEIEEDDEDEEDEDEEDEPVEEEKPKRPRRRTRA